MNKKFALGYLFLSFCVATVISCSSNDKKDEGVSPDVAEATSDVAANGDQAAPPADGKAPADQNATPAGDQANAAPPADGQAAPAAGGDQIPVDQNAAAAPETKEGDMAAAPPPAPDANAAPPAEAAAPTVDQANAAPPPPADNAAAAPAPADNAGGGDLFGAADTGGAAAGGDKPKHKVGVAHIKDAPFMKGGQNMNTVYLARDGDTLESVSQKLFGEDRTKALKKANPALKKGVNVGDKVYFNSPNRPEDKEKLLTVYEDQGLPPSLYTTKEGDSLKSLAQEWYGNENSWKEIYAINKSLTSTKELPAGTELQYWPPTAAVAVYGAKKEGGEQANAGAPPPGGEPNGAPPPPPAPGNNPPPPPVAQNNPPPPGAAAGAVGGPGVPGAPENNMPPPPPAPDLNAPPPPPVVSNKPVRHAKDLSSMAGMDKDAIMYAGIGGILLVGLGLLVALRRRAARRNSGITQV